MNIVKQTRHGSTIPTISVARMLENAPVGDSMFIGDTASIMAEVMARKRIECATMLRSSK